MWEGGVGGPTRVPMSISVVVMAALLTSRSSIVVASNNRVVVSVDEHTTTTSSVAIGTAAAGVGEVVVDGAPHLHTQTLPSANEPEVRWPWP